jgi:hypothetical protein
MAAIGFSLNNGRRVDACSLQPDFVSGRKILTGEHNRLCLLAKSESCNRFPRGALASSAGLATLMMAFLNSYPAGEQVAFEGVERCRGRSAFVQGN